MPLTRSLLALALLSAWSPVATQEPASQVVEEAWPDGSARLRYGTRTLDGAMQRHGSYLRWHAGLVPAVEGAYADGLPSGPWKAWREDGTPLLAGSFNEGRRTGKWELFHGEGKLAGVGECLLGCRSGRWVYFDAQGAKIEAESGM